MVDKVWIGWIMMVGMRAWKQVLGYLDIVLKYEDNFKLWIID